MRFFDLDEAPLVWQGGRGPQFGARGNVRRQIIRLDDLTTRQDRSPLHHVLQLPDIARPGVREQTLHRRGAQPRDTSLLLTEAREEVFGEQWNILPPFP